VIAIDVATGAQTEFCKQRFNDIGRVSWLADGSGVVVNGADPDTILNQLWLVTYPAGDAHRITSDLNDYEGTSFTTDTRDLVTVQSDRTTNLWVGTFPELERGHQISSGKEEGTNGITTTPDGRIVYTVNTNGNEDIWIMDADGSNQRPLVTDPHWDDLPQVSPDGRYLVFTSVRKGFPSLWRVDLDGGNLKQLTEGQEDYAAGISPDGRWIVFESWRSGKRTPWKIPIDGGEPTQIIDKFSSKPVISPDGTMIAMLYQEEQAGSPWRMMVISFDSPRVVKIFDPVSPFDNNTRFISVTWTPDGKSILYLNSRDGTNNLWSQPTDGGPAKQLTNFKENGVGFCQFLRDGKTIVFARGAVRSDVVMLRDFK
jgi:TolB protein